MRRRDRRAEVRGCVQAVLLLALGLLFWTVLAMALWGAWVEWVTP